LCIKYGEERRIWNIKLPKRKPKLNAEEYIKNLIAKFREEYTSKSIYCPKCGCMGCTCIPPENITEDISIWNAGSEFPDMESVINEYFFRPTYLDHVETFLLKHMDKFTPEMLTDVAIMWNAIGGDPEYKLTLTKDIE
jgi:hypothetical protein